MFFKKSRKELKDKCDDCALDATPASQEEIEMMRSSLSGWLFHTEGEINKMTREFHFDDFRNAWWFSNKVAELAEEHNHHPEIFIEWGKCKVTWWSHGIQDVTLKDLDLAAACNQLSKRG